MIFGSGKRTDERLTAIGEQLDESSRRTGELEESVKALSEQLTVLEGKINRHDVAMEELLDELEDKSAGELSLSESLIEEKKKNDELISIIALCEEQFAMMAEYIKDEELLRQQELLKKTRDKAGQTALIRVIDEAGVPVDFDLHEIEGVSETADRELDGTVERVLRPGMVYRGNIVKKALVTAYRFRGEDCKE